MREQKVHYGKFRRNKWADVIYPCGIIAEAPRLGTKDKSKVTCKRRGCLQILKGYIMKSPLAKARDKWLNSEEGKRCCADTAEGQYLHNRLELAFIAGADFSTERIKGLEAGQLNFAKEVAKIHKGKIQRIKGLEAENKKMKELKCPPIESGDTCICPIEELESMLIKKDERIKGLEAGIKHIKKWCSSNIKGVLSANRIANAVKRMCEDTLKG